MAIYSEFSPLNMVIFHSYVSLPEGTSWGQKNKDKSVPRRWAKETSEANGMDPETKPWSWWSSASRCQNWIFGATKSWFWYILMSKDVGCWEIFGQDALFPHPLCVRSSCLNDLVQVLCPVKTREQLSEQRPPVPVLWYPWLGQNSTAQSKWSVKELPQYLEIMKCQ